MARNASERSIPHLRDIFGGGGHNWTSSRRHNDDVNELAYQFQNDAKICSRGKGKDDKKMDFSNDSAISVGSTSEDEVPRSSCSNKKKSKRSRRDNSRTLTERDVKHLERHLSMKKTIRKKIMRDLQQAFVEDPNEFRVEDIPREQLKAEINIQSLSFGTPGHKASKRSNKESNFLDMLRANSGGGGAMVNPPCGAVGVPCDDQDSGHGSPTRELSTDRMVGYNHRSARDEDDEDYDEGHGEQETSKKTSFWRRFTMKGRSKR